MSEGPAKHEEDTSARPAGSGAAASSGATAPQGWDVFISYTRADSLAQADLLHKALSAAGLRVFKDDRAVRPGERWFGAIEDALADCRHFVVLLGQAGLDRWVGAETEVALSRHFGAASGGPRLQIVPVLLEGTPPSVMRTFLAQFQSLHWPAQLGEPPSELLAALTTGNSARARPTFDAGCPYRGLAAFQRDDANLFFGRERDTIALLARLGDGDPPRPGNGVPAAVVPRQQLRWLSIVGGSGTGKSSLLRAGLLPLVEAGALAARTGVERWCIVGPILPGADPVLELAKALSAALEPVSRRDSAALLERLRSIQGRDADQALALWLADRLADDPGRGVLLVIDQFEELFTLADPQTRLRFDALVAAALLGTGSAGQANRLYLATTCRSDLVHRLAEELPALAQQVNHLSRPYVLAPMGLPELRRAIERPAAMAGLDVSELVQALLQDARDDLAGALPLVQHALTTLWAVRQTGLGVDARAYPGGRLTLKSFDDAGRLAGILAREADAVLARIERELGKSAGHGAMELLLSLSHYQPDGRHTRQHLEVDAALRVAGQGEKQTALDTGRHVLDILAGQRDQAGHSAGLRLLSIDDARVDLVHEALLRSRDGQPYWATAVNYLIRHKDRNLQRQNLHHAAEAWAQAQGAWARLRASASWSQRKQWKPLRFAASQTERDYLRRSRWPAAAHRVGLIGVVVTVLSVAGGYEKAESVWSNAMSSVTVRDGINAVRWTLFDPPSPPRTVEVVLGRYTMGCDEDRDKLPDLKCPKDEAPRDVDLRAQPGACTAYGIFEVSFDEYDHYVWSQRQLPSDERPRYPKAVGGWGGHRGAHPVVNVSARDAEGYATWLTERAKGTRDPRPWRLPTEEEWEYVARAETPGSANGVPGPYWWGASSPEQTASAPAKANCGRCDPRYLGQSAPAGQYRPNAFGLYDTVGNVWEWTASAYTKDNQPASPTSTGEAGDRARVLRGGSWNFDAQLARASDRLNVRPDFRVDLIGFRVCRASPIETLEHGAAGR